MKVNLNKPFVDFTGKEIEGKNMAEQLCMFLFNISTLSEKNLSPEQKYLAYTLCNRINKNPGEIELAAEEASFLKQVTAEVLSSGAYGQVADIIETKTNNI